MKASKKFKTFDGEEQMERNVAVLNGEEDISQAEDSTPEVVTETTMKAPDGRPPKPSEDAQPCPNWEKGRKRSRPWLRCQGWALNGHETCRNCHRFQEQAPIFRSVSLETITKVVFNARKMIEGVAEPFKDSKPFKESWTELETIATAVRDEHQNRARDYSSFMRRVQNLVPRVFAEEARGLLSKCESLVSKNGKGDGGSHDAFHEWKAEVEKATEQAEIEGVYSKWIFAGKLRSLYRNSVQNDTLNRLVGAIQQGPYRNRGNGWDSNRGWKPRR